MKSILFLSVLIGFLHSYNVDVKIPDKAFKQIPILNSQIDVVFKQPFPTYGYFGGLIEQESCISLTHSRCWSPDSRLYLKRKNGTKEEGVGLGQITRVWRRDGSIRFDSLSAMRRKYPVELAELSWDSIRTQPDLQMKVMLIMWRDSFNKIKLYYPKVDYFNLLAFTDSAYNGGYGMLRKEIRRCRQTKGCNPNVWFGNVELQCVRSRKAIYGNRSACTINREHVRNVLFRRLLKYQLYNLKLYEEYRFYK